MERSNGNNSFESCEFMGDAQDSSESTGLEEEEGDVRMAKTGRISR